MSKEADLVQFYNDEKREYEYFVKGFDVTESIRVLLKAHKEAYDKERRVFTECKAYCDAEKEFKERIADLEAKLAVSKMNESFEKEKKDNTFKLIEELKQQLAEKEKELKKFVLTYFESETNKPILTTTQIINQDKISFCIEKLEKVKKFVIRQLFITTKGCSALDEAEAKGCNELREETIKEIDNQIKTIKEMK